MVRVVPAVVGTVTIHPTVAASEKCARLHTFDCARVPAPTGLSPEGQKQVWM